MVRFRLQAGGIVDSLLLCHWRRSPIASEVAQSWIVNAVDWGQGASHKLLGKRGDRQASHLHRRCQCVKMERKDGSQLKTRVRLSLMGVWYGC